MSEKTGFTYADMMAMPAHILIGLWNQKRKVLEERIEEERRQQENQQTNSSMPNMSTANSMMGQAKNIMSNPSAAMKMPSMPKVPGF